MMNAINIRRILLSLSIILITFVAYTGVNVGLYSQKFTDKPADAAIILGAAIWNDEPSPVFQARIDHGVDLYLQGKVKVLIFTGGVGDNQQYSEAEVAKYYALSRGVAPQDILTETRSKITQENLSEAKILLTSNRLNSVLLISDPLHMKRAMTMAKDLNINAASSPTPKSLYKSRRKKIQFLIREVFFYIGYKLSRI